MYASLQRASPFNDNIADILNTWTTQSGYPVITVSRHADNRTWTINQRRFILKNKNHTDQSKWEIPLNYVSQNDHSFSSTASLFMFERENENMVIETRPQNDWIIFNVQQTGELQTPVILFFFY